MSGPACHLAAPSERPLRRAAVPPAERARRLAEAGYNIWRLEPAAVELDLFTDVPHWSVVDVEPSAHHPELAGPIEAMFGAKEAIATRSGRGAEHVLAAALARRKAPHRLAVLSHGFFITTERAFRLAGATIEPVPRARAGSSDPDLAWLEARLSRGDVDVVCLEPSNSALAGWPLGPDAVRQVGALCRRSGAMLVLDATRVLTNSTALGLPVIETAAAICGEADAFTASCSKELLVASGGLICARDPELVRECFALAWNLGLHLEPLRLQCELARGLRTMQGDPSPLSRRRRQLLELAGHLRRRRLPIVEPVGGHAVFVRVDELAAAGGPHRTIALEGALFEHGGVRARIAHLALLDTYAVRLAWPLYTRADPADLEAVGDALAALFDAAIPELVPRPDDRQLPLFRTYDRVTRVP
jgi:tryptophanase